MAIDTQKLRESAVIGNQHAEDLRRCCDALDADNKRLREALRWTAAVLNDAAGSAYSVDEEGSYTVDGETRTVEQILDAADAALAQEQGESDAKRG